jgi:hypothetical protein
MDTTWKMVKKELPQLPPPGPKFDDRTWEWTIARDYYMQLLEKATFQLEMVRVCLPRSFCRALSATLFLPRSFHPSVLT